MMEARIARAMTDRNNNNPPKASVCPGGEVPVIRVGADGQRDPTLKGPMARDIFPDLHIDTLNQKSRNFR